MLSDGRLIALQTPQAGPATEYAYWLVQAETAPKQEVLEVARWIRAEADASAK